MSGESPAHKRVRLDPDTLVEREDSSLQVTTSASQSKDEAPAGVPSAVEVVIPVVPSGAGLSVTPGTVSPGPTHSPAYQVGSKRPRDEQLDEAAQSTTISEPLNEGGTPGLVPTRVFDPTTAIRAKTQAAHDKGARIRGDGAAPHAQGPCRKCKRGRGGGHECIVNPNVLGGNTCSRCAKLKEKCSHQTVADGKWIREHGQPASNGPCTQCIEKAAKGLPAECYQADQTHYKVRRQYGTGCSQCQIDGTKESCSINEKPKRRYGKIYDD